MTELAPLSHTELPNHGWKLNSVEANPGRKLGPYDVYHYTQARNQIGGNISRPLIHHVFVHDYKNNPGKPDIQYQVTDGDGNDYAGGDFNHNFYHKSEMGYGSDDPIRDLLKHHSAINFMLDKERSVDPLHPVTPDNLHRIVPRVDLRSTPWSGEGSDDFGYIIDPVGGRVSPPNLRYHNAAPPLDQEVHRRLTNAGFTHYGTLGGDQDTDFYHASYTDPRNPRFLYEATVRHMPTADQPFSYDVVRRQAGTYDDGSGDEGSPIDVTGDSEPVAKLGTINQMVRRHNDVLRALEIKSPAAPKRTSSDHGRFIMEKADKDLRP